MQAITDCTGKTIRVGDFVETPSGKVIQVAGGTVMKDTMYSAALCKVVPRPKDHKPSDKEQAHFSDHLSAAANDTDCVIWGS